MALQQPTPNVRRALLINSMVPIGVTLMLGALLAWQAFQMRANDGLIQQSVEVERKTSAVGGSLLQMERGAHTFMVTQSHAHTNGYHTARTMLHASLLDLRRAVVADTDEVAMLDQVASRELAWEQTLHDEMAIIDDPAKAESLVRLDHQADEDLVGVRDALTRFRRSEIGLLSQRQAALTHSSNIATGIGLVGFTLAIVFFALIGRRQLGAIGRHAAELELANQQLRELDRLKDEFLGNVSHELRTPLNAVLGFGSILEDELAGPLNPQQHTYLNKLLGGAQMLLGLIDDLLETVRFEAGRFELLRKPMDLATCCRAVADQLEPLADRKELQLVLDIPDALPQVCGDDRRLVQVLTNLVGNAIKFTPVQGSVTVRLRRTDGHVRCEVQDTGPGIAATDIPRLFKRFGQVQQGNVRPAGGTGLGLAIAKVIVSAHEGEIGVESVLGQGSVFWFTLPLVNVPGPEAVPAP